MKPFLLIGVVVALSAPAAQASQAGDGPVIIVETAPGPFCGPCYSLKLTVAPKGLVRAELGHWAGAYTDWQVERRRFWVSAERLAQFRQSLAPFRPVGTQDLTGAACKDMTSDQPQMTVIWRENGVEDRLIYDFGCDADTRSEMRRVLLTAPSLLGATPG